MFSARYKVNIQVISDVIAQKEYVIVRTHAYKEI